MRISFTAIGFDLSIPNLSSLSFYTKFMGQFAFCSPRSAQKMLDNRLATGLLNSESFRYLVPCPGDSSIDPQVEGVRDRGWSANTEEDV
jgi:hypothetical protein